MRDWLSLIPKRFYFDPLLSTHSQATFDSSRSPVTCMLIVPKSTLLLQSESQLIMLKNQPHCFPQSFREWEKQVVGAGVERQRGKGVVRGESKGRGGKGKGRAAQTNILQSKQSSFSIWGKSNTFSQATNPKPILVGLSVSTSITHKTSALHLRNSSTFSLLLFSQIPIVIIWIWSSFDLSNYNVQTGFPLRFSKFILYLDITIIFLKEKSTHFTSD